MLISIALHKILLQFLAGVSILGNGTLLLLLLHGRSQVLGNYRHLLASFALTDIVISIYHASYIPIFLLGSYGYAFFGYGTLRAHGFLARWSIIIYTVSFYLPFYILCMHFVYRTLSLLRPTIITIRFRLFMSLYAAGAGVFTLIIVVLTDKISTKHAPNRIFEILAEYQISPGDQLLNYAVVNYQDSTLEPNYTAVAILFVACCLCGGMILFSAGCIWLITVNVRNLVDIRVRRTHVQLFRALLVQFSIPVCLSLVPFSFIILIPATGKELGQAGNVCSLLVSVFPALDPILVIASLGRFRTTLGEWLDVLLGRTAERNEENARERSRMHKSILRNAPRSIIV